MNYWYIVQVLALFSASVAALPIHEAASLGNLGEVQRLLVGNSEKLYAVDRTGRTPIHYASGGGHVDIVDYFLGMERALVKPDGLRRACIFPEMLHASDPWELAYQDGHDEVVAYFMIFAGAKSKIINDDTLAKKRSWLMHAFKIAHPGFHDLTPQDFYRWINKEYWLLWSESWGKGARFSSVLKKIKALPFERLNHLQKFNLLYDFSQEPSSFSLYNEIINRQQKLLNFVQSIILANRVESVSRLV